MKKKINKAIVILTVATIATMLFIGTESAFSKKIKKKKVETKKSSKIVSYPKTGKARLDSLLACIPEKGEPQDTNFVKLLNRISNEFSSYDQSKGIEFAEKALKLAEQLNYKDYIPDIYMAWGNNLNMSYNCNEAIIKYNQALKLFEENNNPRSVNSCYINIGISYLGMQDTAKALEYWNKSLEDSKKYDYKDKITFVYSQIAHMYGYFGKSQAAIEYYNKLISFSEANNMKFDLGDAYSELGWLYYATSDNPKALECFEKARSVYKEIGYAEGEAEIIRQIGSVYSSQGHYNKAIEYFLQALKIFEELDLKSGIADVYGFIAESYYKLNDFPKMLEYTNKAMEIKLSINKKKNLAGDYHLLGNYYSVINEKDSAEVYLNKALDIYNAFGNNRMIIQILVNFAQLYMTSADYAKALEYCYKALKNAEQLEDLEMQGYCYNLLGGIHDNLKEHEKSIKYYSQALEIFQKNNNLYDIASTLTNLGCSYAGLENFDKAIEYFTKSLEISEKLNNRRSIALVYANLGAINDQNKKYQIGLEYYKKAEDIFSELGIKQEMSKIYDNRAEIYSSMALDSAKYTKVERDSLLHISLNLSNLAYDLAEKGKENKIMINLLERLYLIYSKLDKWEEALKYYKKYVQLKDSIFSGENQKKIAELEAKKDLEVKQKENELLAERTKLQESELGRQKEQLALLNSKQQIQSLELDKKSLEISTKSNELSLLEKDKEINNIALMQKEAEQEKSTKEIQLLNKDKQYQGVVRKSLFGGVALLTGLATILFLFFWRKKKDNKKLEEKNIQITVQKEIIEIEQEKSEKLLLNVLPPSIATRLKAGETTIADHYEEASVVFIDIVDFTKSSAGIDPKRVVEVLNVLYTKLDTLAHKHGLEKIKTIGDCYMAAAGVPEIRKDNPEMASNFAIEAMNTIRNYDTGDGTVINFRCGIDCGPVVAGVIGEKKFIYDLWGDTVNTAARMEEYGEPGRIQVTERFKEKLLVDSSQLSDNGNIEQIPATDNRQQTTIFEERGEIEIKGKGKMRTYFLEK